MFVWVCGRRERGYGRVYVCGRCEREAEMGDAVEARGDEGRSEVGNQIEIEAESRV
jgi:hypothetical protein